MKYLIKAAITDPYSHFCRVFPGEPGGGKIIFRKLIRRGGT
jgi:hypothetical protein